MTKHSSIPQTRLFSSMAPLRSNKGKQSLKSMAMASMRHITLVSGTSAATQGSMSARAGAFQSAQTGNATRVIFSITSSTAKGNSPIQLTTPTAGISVSATLKAINCTGQVPCGGPMETDVRPSGSTTRWKAKAYILGKMGSNVK